MPWIAKWNCMFDQFSFVFLTSLSIWTSVESSIFKRHPCESHQRESFQNGNFGIRIFFGPHSNWTNWNIHIKLMNLFAGPIFWSTILKIMFFWILFTQQNCHNVVFFSILARCLIPEYWYDLSHWETFLEKHSRISKILVVFQPLYCFTH